MLTYVGVILIISQCANGQRLCTVHEPTDDNQLYVLACDFKRTSSGVMNHGKILKSYEDYELKLEIIECHDAWV